MKLIIIVLILVVILGSLAAAAPSPHQCVKRKETKPEPTYSDDTTEPAKPKHAEAPKCDSQTMYQQN